jgi:endonuclease/exonuclease/phosphatase (EEP) superfamily protein YafD
MRRGSALHPLCTWCLLVLGLLALGAQLGALHWLGDVLALVADYYLWLGLVLLLVCLRALAWRQVALAGAIVALCGVQLFSYARVVPQPPTEDAQALRLLVYNLYYLNPDLPGVASEVKRHNPDVVFLMEYSYAVQQEIETAFADYPYRLIEPSRFTMGLALFSRLPIETATVHRFAETRIPIYELQLRHQGQLVTFVGGHPWPPQPQWGALHRNQMAEITRIAARAPQPLVVAGDFNAAPWSYMMRQLAAQAEVQHVALRWGLTKTWRPVPVVGLPMDHILVSRHWQVPAYRYGQPGGSDHLPLIVDLRLR